MIIDKDNKTLDFLEGVVNKYGSLKYADNKHTLLVNETINGQKKTIYISKLLYSFYHNKPLSEMENGHTLFVDGNKLNCCRNNLVNTATRKNSSKSVIITTDEEYIYIFCKKSNKQFFTNYEKDLFDLLTSPKITYNYHKDKNYNKLRVRFLNNRKLLNDLQCNISRLIYGYFNYGIRKDNVISRVREMREDLKEKNLIVEHLDSNELNNTIYNLSVMPQELNAQKKKIDKIIEPPYYLIPAYKDGLYKAVFLWNSGGIMFCKPVQTFDNAEDYIKNINKLCESLIFGEFPSAKEYHKATGGKPYNMPLQYKLQKYLYDNFYDELSDLRIGERIVVNYLPYNR